MYNQMQISDKITFLYIDKCIVKQRSGTLVSIDKDGEMIIPCGIISTIFLGPGTTISHDAVKLSSKFGCSLVFCGENCVNCYSYIGNEDRKTDNLEKQIRLFINKREDVSLRFFTFRFKEYVKNISSVKQLMGIEGFLMKTIYKDFAKKYNVVWNKRENDGEWCFNDEINKSISVCNSVLYGLINSITVALGYSPAIGFIHSGHNLSFVFDVADLYKTNICLPVAFNTISKNKNSNEIEKITREEMKKYLLENNTIKKIVKDLEENLLNESLYT